MWRMSTVVVSRVILGLVVVVNVAMILMFVGAGASFSLQRRALGEDLHQRCVAAIGTRLGLSPYGEVTLGRLRFDGEAVVAGTYRINPRSGAAPGTYPARLTGRARCHLDQVDSELVVDRAEVGR